MSAKVMTGLFPKRSSKRPHAGSARAPPRAVSVERIPTSKAEKLSCSNMNTW
jgi:hypothetical protein